MQLKRKGTDHESCYICTAGNSQCLRLMGKKEKGKKNPSEGEDLKREQKLQAIVLADSFMKTFRPISWEKPKVSAC